MDRKQEKYLKKKHERKADHREEVAAGRIAAEKESRGPRIIRPLWLGALGFVLAMLALLRWMAML